MNITYANDEAFSKDKTEISIIKQEANSNDNTTKNEITTLNTTVQKNIFERLQSLQMLNQKYSLIKELCI